MGFNNDRRGFGCASSAKTYTVEDYPLTLPDIKKLKTLSILGNSSQDGTPSPDNPLDVVGTGTRTGNLFDISQIVNVSNISKDGNNLILNDYACSSLLSPNMLLKMTGLKQGDEFTTSRNFEIISGEINSASGRISFSRKDNSQIAFYLSQGSTKIITSGTIPDDFNNENYNNAVFYGCNTGDDKKFIISDLQVLKGSYTADTLPPYEPYGYKVAVTASGRNLFNAVGVANNSEDTDLKIEEYQGRQCLTWIDNETANNQRNMQGEFKEKTQYTFCFNVYSAKTASIFIHYTDGSFTNFSIPCNGAWVTAIKQSTLPKTIDYWSGNFNYATKVAIDIDSSMIVEGAYIADTLPTYEPYKSPQSFNVYSPDVLYGVGAAHDTVILDFDKHKAELKKNILQYEHSDNWILGSSGKNNVTQRFYQPTNNYFVANSRAISNVFVELNPSSITIINNDTEGFNCSNNNYLQVRVNKSRLDTVDDSGFKSWLAAYEETTPLIIYGETLTPVTTDITALQEWKSIPNLKGTWILTAEGGTEPLLKAAYTSNTNPYPDYSNIVSVLPIYPDLDITGDDPTSERGDMEETEDQQETTSTDEPTSETNNSIDILDLYE